MLNGRVHNWLSRWLHAFGRLGTRRTMTLQEIDILCSIPNKLKTPIRGVTIKYRDVVRWVDRNIEILQRRRCSVLRCALSVVYGYRGVTLNEEGRLGTGHNVARGVVTNGKVKRWYYLLFGGA